MSLAEKLKQIVAVAEERIPEASLKLMHQATQELRDSGITDKAFGEGAILPPFELVNTEGENVSSAELLQKGNLVVTFYRGVW